MKDKTPETNAQDLSPCPLRPHCLRLVDALDSYQAGGEVYSGAIEDWHEQQLIEQVRTHLPTCPTCMAALEQARRLCSLQRRMLQEVLIEGEQQVPSTTAQIMQSLKNERQASHVYAQPRTPYETSAQLVGALQGQQHEKHQAARSRTTFRTVCSLVAAAVIVLASLGVFGYFTRLKPAPNHLASSSSLTASSRWSSVVMTSIQDGNATISLYDPQNGRSIVLAAATKRSSSLTPAEVSHDGTKLLYSSFDGKKTTYYLRSLTATTPLFTLTGNRSYATWSTDDRYIFVSTPQGSEQIDVLSKAAQRILPASGFVNLRYYRDGYLYYVNSQDDSTGVLSRADIVHGNVQPITSDCANGSSFWLSPSGVQVYYMCEQSQSGLFVVNSDGTNSHVLRAQAGPMIGYAADESPLTLAHTAGKYQAVKLATDESNDQVVLDDVVPGGGIIPSGAVAVAPFGYTLVARAIYDNYEAIWYGDLTSGKKQQVMKIEKGSQVELYGWSRMQVP